MSTRKLGRTLTWRFTQATKVPLIDGHPADKVKAGDETRNQADERSAAVLPGSRRQTVSPTNRSCSQVWLDV